MKKELQLVGSPRATKISKSLQEVGRRLQRSHASFVSSAMPSSGRRGQQLMKPAMVIGFIAIVAVPALLSGAYLWLIASDQYSVETRFAVRGGERIALDKGPNVVAAQRVQDSLIVVDYIQSRGIVEDLEKNVGLRSRYSRKEADYFWRFNPNRTIEELTNYWRRRVDVSMDYISGVITVQVRAFSPDDALAIAKGVIASSEKLVNELSDRSRRDALRQAHSEIALAETNLQSKIHEMRDLRNTEQLLDAKQSAEALARIHTELRLELIKLEQEYGVQKQSAVSASMPHLRVLEARINSLRQQLITISAQITNASGSQGSVLAESIGKFDRQKLEHSLAEQKYQTAANSLERARIELASQHIYLATYVQPAPAEEALYPQRLLLFSMILFGALALWGAGVGLAIMIRNHMA